MRTGVSQAGVNLLCDFTVKFLVNGEAKEVWNGRAYNDVRALSAAMDKLGIDSWSVHSGMSVVIERK